MTQTAAATTAMERHIVSAPAGLNMARYVVATCIGDELAPYYAPAQLATALVRNGWTWDAVLRVNT